MNSMNSTSSVVWLMYSITLNIGIMNRSNQMEMNRISSKLESLTHIKEFNIFNSCYQALFTIWVTHNLSSILFLGGDNWITLIQNVSGQKTNFSSHFNKVSSEILNSSIVLEIKWLINSYYWLFWIGSIYVNDFSFFSFKKL